MFGKKTVDDVVGGLVKVLNDLDRVIDEQALEEKAQAAKMSQASQARELALAEVGRGLRVRAKIAELLA